MKRLAEGIYRLYHMPSFVLAYLRDQRDDPMLRRSLWRTICECWFFTGLPYEK